MQHFQTRAFRVKFPGGVDGVELAGIVDQPVRSDDQASGEANHPIAIFSHCFTCSKDLKATVRLSRALAQRGVTVMRFDMTGLGGSGGRFSESNFTSNLADLAAAVRFANETLGPVTSLLGHSFGGLAALATAAAARDEGLELPLEDLRCVGTIAAPSDTVHLASLLARLSPEIDASGTGSVTIGGIEWTIEKQMLDDFRRHRVEDGFSKIRCPVLLLHSPVDETVGFEHAIRLMGLIQGEANTPDAAPIPVSLVALEGADHLLVRNPRDLEFVANLFSLWCHR